MALNWVSRDGSAGGFVFLPEETLRFTLQQDVVLELQPIGQPKPETIKFRGAVHLTTHRLVLLSNEGTSTSTSTSSSSSHDSFSLLYKDVASSKLEMPWLGSNRFRAVFRVASGDAGLNYLYPWQLVVSFVEGGAIDFARCFEQCKTRWDNAQADDLPAYVE